MIIELDDYRPRLVINDGKSVHIVKLRDIEDIADGKASIAEFEDPESMARAIAAGYLALMNGIKDGDN